MERRYPLRDINKKLMKQYYNIDNKILENSKGINLVTEDTEGIFVAADDIQNLQFTGYEDSPGKPTTVPSIKYMGRTLPSFKPYLAKKALGVDIIPYGLFAQYEQLHIYNLKKKEAEDLNKQIGTSRILSITYDENVSPMIRDSIEKTSMYEAQKMNVGDII